MVCLVCWVVIAYFGCLWLFNACVLVLLCHWLGWLVIACSSCGLGEWLVCGCLVGWWCYSFGWLLGLGFCLRAAVAGCRLCFSVWLFSWFTVYV